MSLERILVPVESTRSMPRLLSVRSLLKMVALVPSPIKIPLLELPSTSFPEMVTSRDLFEAYRVLTGVSHDVGEELGPD